MASGRADCSRARPTAFCGKASAGAAVSDSTSITASIASTVTRCSAVPNRNDSRSPGTSGWRSSQNSCTVTTWLSRGALSAAQTMAPRSTNTSRSNESATLCPVAACGGRRRTVPVFDAGDLRGLAAGHEPHDIADGNPAAFDAADDDAAVLQPVDVLHRQAQRRRVPAAAAASARPAPRPASGRHTRACAAPRCTTLSPCRADSGTMAAGVMPRPPR